MDHPCSKLYKVRRDAKCVKCGNIGAVRFYGGWYSHGVGVKADDHEFYKEYREKPYMSYAVGFGGTIPYECLNCGNTGLIDMDGLEGYRLAFRTLRGSERTVFFANFVLSRFSQQKINIPTSETNIGVNFVLYEDDMIQIDGVADSMVIIVRLKEHSQTPILMVNHDGSVAHYDENLGHTFEEYVEKRFFSKDEIQISKRSMPGK